MRLVKPLPRTRCSAFPYLLAVTVMLGTWNPTLATSQNVPGELVFRRVAVSSSEIPMGPFGSQVPAEGRYLATADWDNTGADLAIVDLQSKTLTRITDRNARGDSLDAVWAAVFSPDGTQIAYQWAHFSRSDGVENQIRIIGRDGSGERTLITESEPNWIEPKAWTPDGEFIIAHQRRVGATGDGDVELVLVSVRDGNRRVLQRLDRSPGGLFVSPDGRHAAYDLTLDESGNADVHVLDLAGGDSRALVSGNGDDRLMGWDTDGSGIFFYSNRELSGGIWRLPVSGGRVAGDPELVRGDVWDMAPVGFSGHQYFYRVARAAAQIRTATIDFDAGEVVVPPTMIRAPSEGWSREPAWSPDGRHLAFLDYPYAEDFASARARLAIRSIYTGESRFLDFPFASGARMYWTPDATALLVLGRHSGVGGIHRLDLRTGDVTLLRESPDQGPQSNLSLSPDGRTYYFHRNRSEIWAGEVATGKETLLAHVEGVLRRIGVSPDGSTLVVLAGEFGEENGIVLVPATGGEPREIYRGRGHLMGGPFFHMTPDNRYVFAASFSAPGTIWRFSVDGSEEPLKILEGEAPRGFTMSPDGHRIAYWEWPNPEGALELWVI